LSKMGKHRLPEFVEVSGQICEYGCFECHYKYGHKDECSTGKLANLICLETN